MQDVEIRVQDYGVGFDPEKIDEKRFGLAGIRERGTVAGGICHTAIHPRHRDAPLRPIAEGCRRSRRSQMTDGTEQLDNAASCVPSGHRSLAKCPN